jgi:hypothetical protein
LRVSCSLSATKGNVVPDNLQRKLAILLLALMAIPVGAACCCLLLYGLPSRAVAVAKAPGFHAVGAVEWSRASEDIRRSIRPFAQMVASMSRPAEGWDVTPHILMLCCPNPGAWPSSATATRNILL